MTKVLNQAIVIRNIMIKNTTNIPDVKNFAAEAGLRYMHPEKLTIIRTKHVRGFRYFDNSRNKILDVETLKRIEKLKIPPVYSDVHICPFSNGHLQATGKDERGRTQYLYHPEWRIVRDANKFHRMLEFGQVLPHLRRTIKNHLKLRGLPKKKILATIVALIDKTFIRIGNEEYAKTNKSYGLTTMHNRHSKITGADIHFRFRGKRGIKHSIDLHDPELAKIIHNCQDLPGYELFEYKDARGKIHCIESSDVNEYLKSICKNDFTAKDFRTWHATVLAIKYLLAFPPCTTKTGMKKNVTQTIKEVSKHLGNTPAICKKSYIHPGVLDVYMQARLTDLLRKSRKNRFTHLGLKSEEKATLVFLEKIQS